MKRIVAALVALTVLAPVLHADEAHAHHWKLETSRKKYRGILPDRYYDIIASCETRKNWTRHKYQFTGGFGIYTGTAYRWSGRRNLSKLTPRQQVDIADRIAFKGWDNPKKKVNPSKHPAGPWGWGCLRIRPEAQRYICASNHKLVRRWKRGC